MSKNRPKSLSELLRDPGSSVGRLAAKARQKQALGDHVRNGLSTDLAAALLHCSVDENGVLVVRTTSSAWAAKLRFENEKLLELAREVHPETTSVRVRVAYPDE
ncbi:MAG: DciA family protein [Gammaproteobacteria bacterium]